jgi:hypothetical protein
MANEITIKVKAIDAASGVFNAITSRLGESGILIQQTFTGNFAGAIETGVGMAIDYTEEAIDKVIELDGQVDELSRKTGQTLEESSKLIQVAKDAEVSYADLSNALGAATKKGVDVSIDSLLSLADEYNNIHDPIDRAKWLTDNFGAAGEGLAPIFEGGSERIVTAMDNVNEALVWDAEKQQSIDEYKSAVGELKTSFEELKISYGLDTIELLISGINKLVDIYDGWKTKNKEVSDQDAELYAQMGLTTPLLKLYGSEMESVGAQAGLSAGLLDIVSTSEKETGDSAQIAAGQVSGLGGAINGLQDKTVTVTTQLVTNHVDNYFVYGSQGTAINRHAAGGLFEIPAAYGNEGFRLGNGDTASGGEGLQLIPKNQMGNNDMLNSTLKALPKMIAREIRQLEKYG